MKSVFHLCEAFFFLATNEASPEGSHGTIGGIVNPWDGTGFHEDWNAFSLADKLLLKRHLAPLLQDPRWFILWLPLRRGPHNRVVIGNIMEDISGGAAPTGAGKHPKERCIARIARKTFCARSEFMAVRPKAFGKYLNGAVNLALRDAQEGTDNGNLDWITSASRTMSSALHCRDRRG